MEWIKNIQLHQNQVQNSAIIKRIAFLKKYENIFKIFATKIITIFLKGKNVFQKKGQ